MRSKDSVFVDVVCVGSASTRVVYGKAQRVKVLVNGDHWEEVVVMSVTLKAILY